MALLTTTNPTGLAITPADISKTYLRYLTAATRRDPELPLPADLAAVVVTPAAKLVTNPRGLQPKRVSELEPTHARGAAGEWTLAKRLVLARWRVRTGSVCRASCGPGMGRTASPGRDQQRCHFGSIQSGFS